MSKLFLATAVAALVTSGAGASSLSACRGIADDNARLDCYDRIGTTEKNSLVAITTNSDQFSGFYAGVSGHFGGADKNLYERDWYYGDWTFMLNSPSVGAFAGYNQAVGNMVLGVEASLRGDTHRKAFGEITYRSGWSNYYTPEFSTALSDLMNSGKTGVARVPLSAYDSGQMTTSWYDIKEQANPMISARVGVMAGPTLLYGRGGIGASYVEGRFHYRRNETFCDAGYIDVNYSPSSAWYNSPTCTNSREVEGETNTLEFSRLAPTFAAAIGAEYHHDRYFGRIEAEARYIHWGNTFLPSGDSGTMRYQVGIGAGIKF